ncbi:hypothetical protein DSO57_1036503 [Entomophthora muscae]|uniref:Uncharacterized protein n=1 Tax=Entomophthora muscae TaxID=34485 RepID=A0ACC2UA09_9FUNG|nr:hypothetical protein DSO57_1036503 [Entomophthora muscae]
MIKSREPGGRAGAGGGRGGAGRGGAGRGGAGRARRGETRRGKERERDEEGEGGKQSEDTIRNASSPLGAVLHSPPNFHPSTTRLGMAIGPSPLSRDEGSPLEGGRGLPDRYPIKQASPLYRLISTVSY